MNANKDNTLNSAGLAAPSPKGLPLEKFHALLEEKESLLNEYGKATAAINGLLEAEDHAKINVGIEKRQNIINQVNLLDKQIEEIVFVFKMGCFSSDEQEKVEESFKKIENLVSLLAVAEQKCLSRVKARHEAAKTRILDMRAKRRANKGYAPGNGPFVSRFVDMLN